MPVIVNKTLHSFSSEDPQFPASNLLETKVTKKWKCKEAGEKSCFVVLKLDQPRLITGIDIGNERSGFIEVLVGNSLQAQPDFKEILLATSFMTIVEAKNGLMPNRVRCFTSDTLVESVAKEKWDLVKIICSQIYNSRNQYGLSFVTLHTSEPIADKNSPESAVKLKSVTSSEKRKKFGKFLIRAGSSSESEDEKKKKSDNSSPFDRWKASKSGNSQSEVVKISIKDQVKAKIEQNRKRIRVLSDSSDEEQTKPNRNRTTGLLYEDEDDEPNEKLQKKMDKDRDSKSSRDKSPPRLSSTSKPSSSSKFASFISDDPPKSSHKPSSSSSKSKDHKSSSSSKSPKSSHHSSSKSPKGSQSSSSKSTSRSAEKKKSSKQVTYKPFHKLFEGVTFVLSGYVNPERGSLRQKALDMGAKYKQDWDSSCSHLICAVPNTPKYQQVKGKGKIVGKQWIIDCFSEQKRLPWRRYSIVRGEKDEPESEDEIHNILNKPKSPSKKSLAFQSDSDDEMLVVDKRVKNGSEKKAEKPSSQVLDESDEVQILPEPEPVVIDLEDGSKEVNEGKSEKNEEKNEKNEEKNEKNNNEIPSTQKSAMDVSTDDELMEPVDPTHIENQVYKSKAFYLNDDLPATDVIKLNNQITAMEGKVTGKPAKANFIVSKTGQKLPQGSAAEVVTPLWVYECYELGALIPTHRYKVKAN